MSVHLSGTVGGGLPAIFGDAGALEALAGRLDALADQVLSLGGDAARATTGVAQQAGWTGTAADAYLEFCRTKSAAVGQLSGPLHEIAAAVRGYAAVLAAQQRHAHLAVRSVEGIEDPGADAHRITLAESQISAATLAIERAVYQAASRTEESRSELERLAAGLERVNRGWEALKDPLDVLGVVFDLRVARPAESAVRSLVLMESQKFAAVERWAKLGGSRAAYLARLKTYEPYLKPAQWRGIEATMARVKAAEAGFHALGVLSAVTTLIHPGDQGTLRAVNRVVAGLQGVASVGGVLESLNALDGVPYVGEAIMVVDVGATVYFGGKYVVEHWSTVTHVLDTVGDAELSVAKSGVRFASGAMHSVTSSVKGLFRL